MTAAAIEGFFTTLAALNPNPQSELVYNSPFELLVAVVLSAQSTDTAVNKATVPLFRVANTPAAILALGETKLKNFIRRLGLFNTKAKNIIALSEQLLRLHRGAVPRDRAALEALPGVGRKTANVVLNVLWHEATMPVDTHVFRLANRTGLAAGATPLAVERALLKRVPEKFLGRAHHWLVLHGRYVCKARRPLCATCPVKNFCNWPLKNNKAAG